MLGLFGALNLGQRSLQAHRQGVEVAGHNLANVNNPAYTRQRVDLRTSSALPTAVGLQGTGVDVAAVQQLRNTLAELQLVAESSVTGSLEAQQSALTLARTHLGEQIDRGTGSLDGSGAATSVGAGHGLSEKISDFFSRVQSLSVNPASLTERQALLSSAGNLANQFNQVAGRLESLHTSLNKSLEEDVTAANRLLTEIADLNGRIISLENNGRTANDLRDLRQQKLEGLAKLIPFTAVERENGGVDLVSETHELVTGKTVENSLETFEAAPGRLEIRTQPAGNAFSPSGGRLHGLIHVRDTALADLRNDLDSLAGLIASEVNAVHSSGFSLTGSTGAAFFEGTTAATIRVNPDLVRDPRLIQAAGSAGAPGDNQIALALAQLAQKSHPDLQNQTFSQAYNRTVAVLGESLSTVNQQIEDQKLVENLLKQQRDSISGVSLDEEMTDMMRFQKAYEASARLITTIDEMLDTVLTMKR